jgi:Sec-independent protein secretion pathway component TatC
MVFCAVVTPGPDAVFLVLMELPVIFIYEESVIILKTIECFYKKKSF